MRPCGHERVGLRRVGAIVGKKILLPSSMDELLTLATSKLQLPSQARQVFFKDGDGPMPLTHARPCA